MINIVAAIADFWPLFAAAIIFGLLWGIWMRVKWDEAWKASGQAVKPIPGRCWTYSVSTLEEFVTAVRTVEVGKMQGLDFYVRSILKRADIAFAVALSAATVWVWSVLIVWENTYEFIR
jgi:hypothetical protein